MFALYYLKIQFFLLYMIHVLICYAAIAEHYCLISTQNIYRACFFFFNFKVSFYKAPIVNKIECFTTQNKNKRDG